MKSIINRIQGSPRRAKALVVSALFALFSSVSQAGGPLLICESGVPILWPSGGQNVPYNPDQGALGILDTVMATQAVDDAFQAWEDVATSTISYSNQGALPVDVDVTNFVPFLQPAGPDGLSAIVFDDTGEIFDLLFGAGSGVLGFATPEFVDESTCTILEGVSFLNGPAIGSLEGLLDLMVHEFGHYSNLAHTEVNGQLYADGDSSGPGTDTTTFGPVPVPTDPSFDVIETMYPFLFSGIDQKARTPHADDIAALSNMYPEPSYSATTTTVSGTILFGNVKITGVNVIARNLSDPYADAVSAISSDFTRDYSQGDPVSGTYTLTGLTPGADYAIFVNTLLAGDGRFSTPSAVLPGPEEYYNGANESSDGNLDDPLQLDVVSGSAGQTIAGVDVLFNLPTAGSPLPTGDDGNVAIPLPFSFCVAGEAYDVAFVNGNGFLTFGTADTSFLNFIEDEAAFLSGPPRIAGFWDDLSPNEAGSVFYDSSSDSFSVTWEGVPEFGITDGSSSNTFSIQLRDNSFLCGDNFFHHRNYRDWFRSEVKIIHGDMTATDGLVGVSSGIAATSQFEVETDLSEEGYGHHFNRIQLFTEAAQYEVFNGTDEFDLANGKLKFIGVGSGFPDRYERRTKFGQRNNTLETASRISLPFDSKDTFRDFTALSPSGEDIDFYQISQPLSVGNSLVVEVLTGQIDSVLGIFRCNNLSTRASKSKSKFGPKHRKRCDTDEAELVAVNDDSNGLLSRIVYEVPEDGVYVIAVSYFGDLDFDGEDPGQGEDLDGGRYVLDAFVVDGSLLSLSDDSATEIDLGFDFDYQGVTYNSVFVNSNGFLTFGGGAPFEFSPSVASFESGLPRIAPLWTDLNPSSGGLIVASTIDGLSRTISYIDVPEFSVFDDGGANSYTVTLSSSGDIQIDYGNLTADSGIAGIAEGGGFIGTAVDLSATPSLSATGSTYEEFLSIVNDFDLANSVVEFLP